MTSEMPGDDGLPPNSYPAEMVELIRCHEWSSTPLGPQTGWEQSLRTTVDIMLASGHPMCVMWGQEYTFLYNDAYAPILGTRHPQALGLSGKSVWPEIWEDILPLIERTYAGETCTFSELPLTMLRHGFVEETWWDFSYSPLRNDAGKLFGLLNVTSEATSRVVAERERDMAIAELAHRIKNTMSVVQAIANQTIGKFATSDALKAFGDRLGALAASHDLLTKANWSATRMDTLASTTLAMFGEHRFEITGPPIDIAAHSTTALTLMLHELATNAVKYGALSVPDGKVHFTWDVQRKDSVDWLEVNWNEVGGPPATAPNHKGFGSRIIQMGLTGSGGVTLNYENDGLKVVASAPLQRVQQGR